METNVKRDCIFRSAEEFTCTEEYEKTSFYRRKSKESIAEAKRIENTNKVFEAMKNLNKLRQFGEGKNRKGEQIWHLSDPKMEVCEEVAENLGWDAQKVYRNFPEWVKQSNTTFHECSKCRQRKCMCREFNKIYNHRWDHKIWTNRHFTREQIKNSLRIRSKTTGNFKKLNIEEQIEFRKQQKKFMALETHYMNKKKATPFWNNLTNNIPKKCVLMFCDHSASQHLGVKTKNKSFRRRTKNQPTTDYIIPFGVCFGYRDQDGNTKWFHCLSIPDTLSLTSFEAICMVEDLLRNIDGELVDVLQNANRFIVTLL